MTMAEATVAPDGAVNPSLFSQVTFHIIETDLSSEDITSLRAALVSNGATEHQGRATRDLKFDLEGLTHVIAATINFECYDYAENHLINVVRPDWVRVSISRQRLPNPKQFSVDPRMIFSGLVVCIASDIPEGDKDALVGGIVAMGGLYASQISRQVTHVVALSMEPRECKVVVDKKLACQVVLPHWFDDCLRLSRKIDEEPYQLPNAKLKDGDSFTTKEVSRPDMVTAMYQRPSHLPDIVGSEDQRLEELDVFQDKKILLHTNLDISEHLRSTIEDLVSIGGGKVIRSVEEADTLVCHWREGYEYRKASQQGKVVGNLSWLYHLITHNRWTSPLDKLLHYPYGRQGIPGFSQYKLSLSNYSGEARVYLENLAKAAGSTFTKAFKTENTHLITAHERSEKVDAAKEWDIHIVNHLWLEDCYAQWEVLPVGKDRYTHMPLKANMSEVVGQTSIDIKALEKHFYPKSSGTPKYNTPLRDSEEESVGQAPDDDIFMTAHAKDEESGQEQEPGDSNEDMAKMDDVSTVMQEKDLNAGAGKTAEPATPALKKTKLSRPSKSATKIMKTPKTPFNARRADGKENETPITTGGRSAKTKAASRLHSMASDIELFQKEMKRVGGVTHGGRRSKEDLVTSSADRPPSRKRSVSAEDGPDTGADDDDSDEDGQPPSKKKAKMAPPSMRLLITGWGGGRAAQAKAALRDIGIMLTEEPSRCTHLAASRIVRTKKFVCALAYAPTVVSTAFVEDSLARRAIQPTAKYPLRDADGEKKYAMSLARSAERAKANKRRLFAGMLIYLTKDIHGGYDTFEDIVRANGGVPHMFSARPGAIASRRVTLGDGSEDEDEDEDGEDLAATTLHLVRGDTPAEAKLAERFVQMAAKAHWKAKVVNSDWLLNSALSQELLDADDHAF